VIRVGGRRRRCVVTVLAVSAIASAACTSQVESGTLPAASPQAQGQELPAVTARVVAYRPLFPMTIARLMTPTAAVSSPGGGRVVERLSTSVRAGGGPTQLLVLRQRNLNGAAWLQVRLPDRPNTAVGWIDANIAQLSTTPWRIVVSTERRVVDVYWQGQHVKSFRAVVGAPGSPTPHGLFAVLERIRTGSPDSFYGTWVLSLTAHSNVYQHFDGGDGRVAIHGRGGASLTAPLGGALSHGCVRLDNSAIDWLSGIAEPGTPVEIV
jgi:lipoprotein-anchoring transpeptidase ErfK/SrfK